MKINLIFQHSLHRKSQFFIRFGQLHVALQLWNLRSPSVLLRFEHIHSGHFFTNSWQLLHISATGQAFVQKWFLAKWFLGFLVLLVNRDGTSGCLDCFRFRFFKKRNQWSCVLYTENKSASWKMQKIKSCFICRLIWWLFV